MTRILHTLTKLPPPPSGKTGWPWTVELEGLPDTAADIDWPKITIVTPSYNQGQFIEETIRCILLQGYPNLEYIIIDGGSTDGSVEIIRKYEPWLAYWVSEPDANMNEALNKGFSRSTGEIMGWSPTGDLYVPSAFTIVATVFCQFSEIEWLTSRYKVKCDELGRQTAYYSVPGFSRRAFRHGMHFGGGNKYAKYNIQQQSTFWKRELWDKSGSKMDASLKAAGDFDLWARFCQYAELYAVDTPIGIFRTHTSQTSVRFGNKHLQEKQKAFKRSGGKHLGSVRNFIREKVIKRLLSRFRPFGWFAYKIHIAYRANIVEWNSETQTARMKRSYFV